MESPPFIPDPPSSTSSDDSYFTPQICTDSTLQPPELNLCAIYQSQRSRPYPRPVLMSSKGSINLSNVSPAESSAPLPIPRPVTPIPPAMSPRTTQTVLATNDDGTVSGFADTDGPKSNPHIADLYAQADDQYTEEGDARPALPL